MKVTQNVPSYAFGIYTNDYHNEYDWHDIDVTHTYTTKTDGTIDYSGPVETRGAYRTTTNFDWGEGYVNTKLYAESKVSQIPLKATGGIHFMAEGYGFGGLPDRSGDESVRIEDITEFMQVLQGFGTNLGAGSGGFKNVGAMIKKFAGLEALDILSKTMERGSNLVDAVLNIHDAIEKNLDSKAPDIKIDSCGNCSRKFVNGQEYTGDKKATNQINANDH